MDSTTRLLIAAILQLALLAAITALAIAGVIPGSTVVALLGSHLAIRALAAVHPPSGPSSGPSSGAGGASGSSSSSSSSSRPIGFMRSALAATATAALRLVDPLAELGAVLAGGAAVLELGHQVPVRARPRIGFVAGGSLAAAGALALVLSLTTACTPQARQQAAGVVDALDGPACTLVSLLVGDRAAGVVCEEISTLLERALSIRAAAPPGDPIAEPVAAGGGSCVLVPLDDAGRPMGWICADLAPAARRALGTRHAR